jgi:Flp pilus assembly protein protease CpaA
VYFWLFLSPLTAWICIVDVREHRIPNKALLLLALLIEIHLVFSKGSSTLHSHIFALLTFFSGYGLGLTLRGAIGMGDIKLMALLTLLNAHLQSTLKILIYASVLALIWAIITRKRSVPFGPSLLAGYFLTLIL